MALTYARNKNKSPKVIWEELHRHPSWQRMDSPVVCATICAMLTADSPITQLPVHYIHTTQTDTQK